MGASHSTKLYDPLILAQNSIKSKRFVKSSTTEGYSCYYYYEGCNCDKIYSDPNRPTTIQESPKRKKSSLKRSHGKQASAKRVHFKTCGNKKNTISPQKEEAVIMNRFDFYYFFIQIKHFYGLM